MRFDPAPARNMLSVDIPGYQTLRLDHVVFDYNGTLACDDLLVGVKSRLNELAKDVHVQVVTADTFGKARAARVAVARLLGHGATALVAFQKTSMLC
jgi:hypothetical protein